MKHIYPAVFTEESDGRYSIHFPDLVGTNSQGDDLVDAFDMAKDSLEFYIARRERDGEAIPKASSVSDISVEKNQTIALIEGDTDVYHKEWGSKSVKKTLTIPGWLNARAEAAGVNFSQTLQEALKEKLG